mmetsp:Transcript_705/g.1505  ORF Transcript_705/g.1505 Transcript_705/m.1505 type:complete len:315 (-) Transcript_705:62-1006(-)
MESPRTGRTAGAAIPKTSTRTNSSSLFPPTTRTTKGPPTTQLTERRLETPRRSTNARRTFPFRATTAPTTPTIPMDASTTTSSWDAPTTSWFAMPPRSPAAMTTVPRSSSRTKTATSTSSGSWSGTSPPLAWRKAAPSPRTAGRPARAATPRPSTRRTTSTGSEETPVWCAPRRFRNSGKSATVSEPASTSTKCTGARRRSCFAHPLRGPTASPRTSLSRTAKTTEPNRASDSSSLRRPTWSAMTSPRTGPKARSAIPRPSIPARSSPRTSPCCSCGGRVRTNSPRTPPSTRSITRTEATRHRHYQHGRYDFDS